MPLLGRPIARFMSVWNWEISLFDAEKTYILGTSFVLALSLRESMESVSDTEAFPELTLKTSGSGCSWLMTIYSHAKMIVISTHFPPRT